MTENLEGITAERISTVKSRELAAAADYIQNQPVGSQEQRIQNTSLAGYALRDYLSENLKGTPLEKSDTVNSIWVGMKNAIARTGTLGEVMTEVLKGEKKYWNNSFNKLTVGQILTSGWSGLKIPVGRAKKEIGKYWNTSYEKISESLKKDMRKRNDTREEGEEVGLYSTAVRNRLIAAQNAVEAAREYRFRGELEAEIFRKVIQDQVDKTCFLKIKQKRKKRKNKKHLKLQLLKS